MSTTKYLVAKYVPDLQRMEPRNIGVVVWSPSGVEARFAAEKSNCLGDVDGRSIPAYVNSPNTYRQWIKFWRAELKKSETPVGAVPSATFQGSPEFIEAFKLNSRGNFLLVDGGFLLDEIDEDELPHLTDHLFTTLVGHGGAEEPRDLTLDEVCKELISEANLHDDPRFYSRYRLNCPVGNTTEDFEFSYAYGNDSLQWLYQQVPLPKRKRQLRKNVHDSAWMFEKVVAAQIVEPEQGAALVYVNEEEQEEPEVGKLLQVLNSVTRVLNLHDPDDAQRAFQSLPADPG